MKTLHKLLILLGVLLLSACNNYLDVKPVGKILPETADDFSTIIHRWLNIIERGQDNVVIGTSESTFKLDCYGDDLEPSMATSTYIPRYVGLKINENQDNFPDYYAVIKDCNMIIDNMEDTKSELARKVLGAAWTLRSICYYNLLINYCEAYDSQTANEALGLSLIDNFDMEAKVARSSMQQTVDFIEDGFKKALSYKLTDKDFIITEDVANGYLARLYFWSENWDQAIAYATPLLEKYPMLEATEYAEEINQKLTKTKNTLLRSYVIENDMGSWDFVFTRDDSRSLPVSKTVVDLFNAETNDVRTAVAFDNKRLATKAITAKFRSEELCLIIAEAYAHKGDAGNALTYLNSLRSKRITEGYADLTEATLPEVSTQNIVEDATGKPLTKLMSSILCERRKEFFLEGSRWYELKRNGCPEYWVSFDGRKYTIEKYLYTYPIYKKDVDLFQGLIIQNPGYIY